MNAWTLESMNKSILYDVINVIDHVSRHKDDFSYLVDDFLLLKQNTIQIYMQIYKIAGEYEDSISSAMYIPEKDVSDRWTVLHSKLSKKIINFMNFDDLAKFLRADDPQANKAYILHRCLREEQKTVPEDMIEQMIENQNLMSISILEKTHLPQKIKFSLTTLLLNYAEYIESLIAFLSKVHIAVQAVYEQYKTNYRYTARSLRTYLNKYEVETLFNIDMQNQLRQIKKSKKYNIVLSLLRPEYADTFFEDRKVLIIRGFLFVQRILHDEQFELF